MSACQIERQRWGFSNSSSGHWHGRSPAAGRHRPGERHHRLLAARWFGSTAGNAGDVEEDRDGIWLPRRRQVRIPRQCDRGQLPASLVKGRFRRRSPWASASDRRSSPAVLGEGICVSQLRIALVPGGTLAATTSMTIAPSPAPGQQHAGRHPGKPGPLARRPRIF
jgi:hypothetical protein